MSVIDTLITDRTQSDVINRTPLKCAADYICLNRVEQACAYIADYLGVSISTKTWKPQDFRTTTEMKRIRNNIQLLMDSYFVKDTTPDLPTVIQYTSPEEANNIEQILKDIDEIHSSKVWGQRRLAFKLGTKPYGTRR